MSDFTTEFEKFKTPKEIIKDALTAELNLRLSQCTVEQQEFFKKIFPKGTDNLDTEKLSSAIDLLHRTLVKNRIGR